MRKLPFTPRSFSEVGPLIFTSLFLALIIFLNIFVPTLAQNDKCADPSSLDLPAIQDCLDNLNRAREQSVVATAGVQKQIDGIKARVSSIEINMAVKQQQINRSQEELEKIMDVLYATIRNYYMESQGNCPVCDLLLNTSISDFVKIQAYEKTRIDRDKAFIINTAHSIQTLQERKTELEGEKIALAAVKTKLDKVVTESKAYQATLSSQIASLSARQQQIIAQRGASLNIPRSAAASALYCTNDRNIDPGFSPRFAFFTFGIPHYVGLNQYGAYGRANAGQNYKDILTTYYQNTSVECRDLPAQIDVQGYGQMPFDDYIKGVVNLEMGADIPEALKAQAIAARGFAISQSKPICTSQYCQVYSSARRGSANDAVDATGVNACGAGKGEVVIANGEIANTWFASTFGGFAHRSSPQLPNAHNTSYTKEFADTTGPVNSFSDLFDKAYDKESKCFYTAQGWRDEYKKSAWLKPSEVADIVNSLMLFKQDSSTGDHLFQTDKPHPFGGENWDEGKVKQELQNRSITPYNSISDISAGADFGTGNTTSINVSGDAGSRSFSGGEFKDMFNLRAPANLHIPGRLYNVERQ